MVWLWLRVMCCHATTPLHWAPGSKSLLSAFPHMLPHWWCIIRFPTPECPLTNTDTPQFRLFLAGLFSPQQLTLLTHALLQMASGFHQPCPHCVHPQTVFKHAFPYKSFITFFLSITSHIHTLLLWSCLVHRQPISYLLPLFLSVNP